MDMVKRDNDPMEWSTVPYSAPQGPASNGKQLTSSLEAPIMLLSGHQSVIYTMKFNPAGTVIAYGSHDREIFLWRVHGDYKNFMVLKGHKSAILIFIGQLGVLGLWGQRVDAIEHYITEIDKTSKEIAKERQEVLNGPNSQVHNASSFRLLQTSLGCCRLCSNPTDPEPTQWLTEWAPEPRDVYWLNLAIPYVSLTVRRLLMHVAFFFIIPIAFV